MRQSRVAIETASIHDDPSRRFGLKIDDVLLSINERTSHNTGGESSFVFI